jgi:protein involved in polysaccharide export with SLBB domain
MTAMIRPALPLFLGLMLTACASGPSVDYVDGNPAERPVVSCGADTGTGLIPGDKVKISVFGQPELSGEFTVTQGGTIDLPLLGPTKVEGLSPDQAAQLIATRLQTSGVLREPRVAAETLTLRPFSVLGEVNRPGEYPSRSCMTLFGSVAAAGGFTIRGDQSYVLIQKAGEGIFKRFRLDSDIAVYPGDVIQVPQRFF